MAEILRIAEPNDGFYYDEMHRPCIRVLRQEEFQAFRLAGVPVVDHKTLWDPYYQYYFPSRAASRQLCLFTEEVS